MSLRNAKGYLKDMKSRIKSLNDDRDLLNEKFKRVTQERNDMHAKFETAVMQLRQKANYKNYMLEQKLVTFRFSGDDPDPAGPCACAASHFQLSRCQK